MEPSRRLFLKGVVIATTAPGIVSAESLMKIAIPKFSLLVPNVLNLFMRGDPDGERMQSKDFWSWTDLDDSKARTKLRALGIRESFLSGDVSSESYVSQWSRFHRETLLHLPPETEDEVIFWSRVTGVSVDLLGASFKWPVDQPKKDPESEIKHHLYELL